MDTRKLTRRSFLRLAGAAAAGVVAVACQPGAKPPAGGEPTPAGGEPAKAAGTVELRFIKLSMVEQVGAYFNDKAVPEFQETYPNLKLKVDMSDWDHLGEKLLTSFAGNLPIDLVETGSDWVGPYARRKQFASIEDYVAKDYQDEIGDFYKEMADISRFDGKLMGLPFVLDIRTMCYRKDHFSEVGLDPAKPPQTWDDLLTFGSKLVKVDAQGNFSRAGYLFDVSAPSGAFFEYWYLMIQNGINVVEPWGSWNPEDVKFNSPEGVEALQFMYDLINKHKIGPMTGMSVKNPDLSALAEGVASMTVQGSWEIGNWKLYQPDKLPLLGIGVPLQKKKRLTYVCPNVYAVGSNTKHPDEAWKLMKFMVSKEVMTGMLSPENSSPPRKSVATEAEYMKDPLLKAFQDIPDKGWGTTTPQATDFPTLEIIGNYVQAVLRSEIGVKAALDKSAEEVKKKISESLQAP